LLFWPGVVGEFMKYLPATVILCLAASLAMALVFLPTLGTVLSTKQGRGEVPVSAGGRAYRRVLTRLLNAPGWTLVIALALVVLVYMAYGRFNHGVEFFPSVEPDSAQLLVRARGDYSVQEKDAVVKQVEARLSGMSEVKALYARSFAAPAGQ